MDNRIAKIKSILNAEKRIEVTDLRDRLEVSEVTIRKDLARLENEGFLLRRYGGAILAENPGKVVGYLKKTGVKTTEKTLIANFAASTVLEGQNILVDAGSTTFMLVRELRGRDIRVVSNNAAVGYEFISDSNLVVEMLGGTLRKPSGALIGAWTLENLAKVKVDKVFLGATGFDIERGFSSENAVEAEVKRKMLECGGEVVILADSSKFARPAFANFATLDDVDMVITEAPPPSEAVAALRKANVEIKIAKK
jgi:DeoR/GlpR family transcriptional regulator of sugar metabolism